MAPSPEYDKEPKAPDKSATNISNEDSKLLHTLLNDQHHNSDHKTTNSAMNSEVENNKHVETLDDDKLRALLNEALTYKCPKDREGKSSLFKELLEEVEQDDQEACEAAARSLTGCRGSRRGARGRRALPHSNSLQDLVAALAAEPAPRRAHARPHAPAPAPASVSARAIHGGSLPSGVDTSSLLSEEGSCRSAGGGYLATVRCVNPPPLAERRVSAGDDAAPTDLDPLHRRSKPMFPMTYTARATLEIGSGSVCSGRAVTTTTASNQVDSAIPFSCISSPEVVAACTTTPSAAHAPLAIDPKPLQLDSQHRAAASVTGAPPPDAAPLALRPRPDDEQPRSVIASSFNGLPLTRPGPAAATAADDYKKSLDENGNSVQGYSSPLSGSGQNKKPRRKKSSKNETVIDCRQLDGYQGHKDVNELLRFIENDAAARPKLRAKHRDDDDRAKKRADPRRKGKDERAASLEELSRTTLEELTAAPPRPPAAPERRSWGDAAPPPDPPAPAQEHADFQTVTKKRRARRRADDAPPRRARAPEPRRRESAPPSDRSNDSNDDLDSVHSLPEAPRAAPPAPPAPPHASYADIARTRHNIPDLIESCNYYGEGEAAGPEAGAPPPPDADPYPALERAAEPRRAPRDKPRDRKERASAAAAAAAAAAAPDVLADRRPAVILLDCAARPRDMDGVTFGFDINEQLVGGGARACDLLQHAVAAVPVRAAKRALRWLPPPPPPPPHHHLHQIIDYVGHAWEDAVRCGAGVGGGGGKARYYSE